MEKAPCVFPPVVRWDPVEVFQAHSWEELRLPPSPSSHCPACDSCWAERGASDTGKGQRAEKGIPQGEGVFLNETLKYFRRFLPKVPFAAGELPCFPQKHSVMKESGWNPNNTLG